MKELMAEFRGESECFHWNPSWDIYMYMYQSLFYLGCKEMSLLSQCILLSQHLVEKICVDMKCLLLLYLIMRTLARCASSVQLELKTTSTGPVGGEWSYTGPISLRLPMPP